MKYLKLKDNEDIPNNFTGVIENCFGTKQWYKKGELHREDGPAIEVWDGSKDWCIEGKRHRIDGPAVEHANGTKAWYKEGKLHREDGPAVEHSDGDKEWWIGGKEYSDTIYVKNKIFLGKEKGKYGLEWLKFLTETGIEEYPLVPGMNYEFVQRYDLQSFLTTQENVLK